MEEDKVVSTEAENLESKAEIVDSTVAANGIDENDAAEETVEDNVIDENDAVEETVETKEKDSLDVEFVEDDKYVYIAYDRERNNKIKKSYVTGLSEAAKEILFAKIPKSALEKGEVTTDTVRAKVISKAGINSLVNKFTVN